MTNDKTAILVGATGLTGKILLELLGKEYKSVLVFARKDIPDKPKNVIVHVMDFAQFNNPWGPTLSQNITNQIKGADLYYTFGTTLKAAGSKDEFIRIEKEIGCGVLRYFKSAGCERLFLMSSQGANTNSKILYSMIKGEVEDYAKSLSFSKLFIFRPSLLLGDRSQKRFFEQIFQNITGPIRSVFSGPLKHYRPIRADEVARAMLSSAKSESSKNLLVIENEQML